MKITKRQLKRIIQEEKMKLLNEQVPGTNLADDDAYYGQQMKDMQELYDALVVALTKAKKAGIEYTDFQTILDDAQSETGY